jgi:hypothetical protein
MRRNDCTRTADDAEELQHGDLAELAPPVAVGSEDDVGAVEGERGYGGVQVPVGERDVVGLGDRLRGLRRRHHQRGHLAQAEHHERPVLVREAAHRAVDGWASDEVVEAADQRQCPWTRRQVKLLGIVGDEPGLELGEDDEQHGHGQGDEYLAVFHCVSS